MTRMTRIFLIIITYPIGYNLIRVIRVIRV